MTNDVTTAMGDLKDDDPGVVYRFLRLFRGLFAEVKNGKWEASKANVAFWIVLGICVKVWLVAGTDIPDNLMYVLLLLLGYSGWKKVEETKQKKNNLLASLSASKEE